LPEIKSADIHRTISAADFAQAERDLMLLTRRAVLPFFASSSFVSFDCALSLDPRPACSKRSEIAPREAATASTGSMRPRDPRCTRTALRPRGAGPAQLPSISRDAAIHPRWRSPRWRAPGATLPGCERNATRGSRSPPWRTAAATP